MINDALAELGSVPQLAWLLIFKAACLTLDMDGAMAPTLFELLQLKAVPHATAASLSEANEHLADAALMVAQARHSPLLYSLYTRTSLQPAPLAAPLSTVVRLEYLGLNAAPARRFSMPQSMGLYQAPMGTECPYNVGLALEALCMAIERNLMCQAMHAAYALVAAGRVYNTQIRCDRKLDPKGIALRAFLRRVWCAERTPFEVRASVSWRAEVLVWLVVAHYSMDRDPTLLHITRLLVSAAQSANYYSPYAMAVALLSQLLLAGKGAVAIDAQAELAPLVPSDPTLDWLQISEPLPANSLLYPSTTLLEPEDHVLAASTVADRRSNKSALSLISSSSFYTDSHQQSTVLFMNRLKYLLVPSFCASFSK